MSYYCRASHFTNVHCATIPCPVYIPQCDGCRRYQEGKVPARYPLPALASSSMVMTLAYLDLGWGWHLWWDRYAWDGVWQENVFRDYPYL